MEFHTFGKPDKPAVLLLPGGGLDWQGLHAPLEKLQKSYYLVLGQPEPGEPRCIRLDAVEQCLEEHFLGRIRGAYGLGEGASLLLELASQGRTEIGTLIAESPDTLPAGPLTDFPGRVIYWYNSRDKAARKRLKSLRELCPALNTVKLKKLSAGERYLTVRPDKMLRRLRRSFGDGRMVNLSVLLELNADALCRHLTETAAVPEEAVGCPNGQTRTLTLSGAGDPTGCRNHRLRLEALDENLTLCTHQLELEKGALSAFSAARAKKTLKKTHGGWVQSLNTEPAKKTRRRWKIL